MNRTQFVAELAKLRPSSTFLTLIGYRNEHSELADYSIVFHMSYENALHRSIEALSKVNPTDALQVVAKQELLDGYRASLNRMAETSIEEVDDAYTRFFDEQGNYIKGVKLHTATQALHLYGLIVHKRVHIPGMYKKSNKRALTVAKDQLRKLCPVNKFRQFKILPDQVERITVENLSLLPPEV